MATIATAMDDRQENQPTLQLHRFSVAQYLQMAQSGVLTERDRVELLDGVIYEMSPVNNPHRIVVTLLTQFFVQRLSSNWHCCTQQPIQFDAGMPEPDVSILRGVIRDYADRYPEPADVRLLIEVSDSSLQFDMTQKLEAYAAAGIPEYWVADLQNRQLRRWTEPMPENCTFQNVEQFQTDAKFTWSLSPEQPLMIPVDEFFP